jgi:penicillin-binding protein-related factor A (putative recombinase)
MIGYANRGRFFEEYLQYLHNRYRAEGRARIDFISVPTQPRKDAGRVTWVPAGKGIVDFVGLLAGGRFVAFDAKSTRKTDAWRVKTNRRSPRNDTEHQWDYLRQVHELGGLAFYLIFAEQLDRVFLARMVFPVEEAQAFADMIEVPKDENGWWDWLGTLEQAQVVGAMGQTVEESASSS